MWIAVGFRIGQRLGRSTVRSAPIHTSKVHTKRSIQPRNLTDNREALIAFFWSIILAIAARMVARIGDSVGGAFDSVDGKAMRTAVGFLIAAWSGAVVGHTEILAWEERDAPRRKSVLVKCICGFS